KLGAMCGGGAIGAIAESAKYAATRRQFGQPIASFGAIKHKLGEMVVRTYAIESLLYRTAGLVDARIAATPHEAHDGSAALAAFEKTSLMVVGLAMQTYGAKLTDQQEVLMHLADIIIDVFSAESAVLRAQAAADADGPRAALHVDAAQVFVNDAAMRIDASAR